MAVFSTNQVRHLYVVKAVQSDLDSLADPGDVAVAATADGDKVYFQYKGALGDIMSSDKIDVAKITSATATASDDLAYVLNGYEIALDSNCNGGELVAGQDYILRVVLKNYIGLSDEDQGFKYGYVHVSASMTISDFYKKMAFSLAKSVARDAVPPFAIYAVIDGEETEIVPGVTVSEMEALGDATALRIYEAPQPWILGKMPQAVITIVPQPTTIFVDGDVVRWGTVEKVDSERTLPEGQKIADLEYFCMGERGDQYRNMGFPYSIPTAYLVDPTQDYDVVNIHYFFSGEGMSALKSEKDIQLACVDDGSHTVANAVIEAINSAAGTEIATL